jgi:hypothetical protein
MNVLPLSIIFSLQLVLLYHSAVAAASTGRSANDVQHENMEPPPPSDVVEAAHGAVGSDNRCDMTAAAVIENTQRICGGTLIDEALRTSVHLEPQKADAMASVLSNLGFWTALDLQLLASQPEVEELMLALKKHDLPIGDRAKVRLLISDRAHLDSLFSARSFAKTRGDVPSTQKGSAIDENKEPTRVLQEKSGTSSGISMDTIAIVLSVLVGAAGYFVQGGSTELPGTRMFTTAHSSGLNCIIFAIKWHLCVISAYTSRRAEHTAAKQAREMHISEMTRQREHEQMLAQITRTDRCVCDCLPWLPRLYSDACDM